MTGRSTGMVSNRPACASSGRGIGSNSPPAEGRAWRNGSRRSRRCFGCDRHKSHECFRVDQSLIDHDFAVLKEAHIGFKISPLLGACGSGRIGPRAARPQTAVHGILFGKPLPQIEPEPCTVGAKACSAVQGGVQQRYCGNNEPGDCGYIFGVRCGGIRCGHRSLFQRTYDKRGRS